jgi:hypothetical protein
VRICCPRFWFWTDILRPLVSFPSPLQEVEILCVCLCLVIFLSSLVLCKCFSSLFAHNSQRCFVVCALLHEHLSLSFRFICASFAANGSCPVRKWIILGVGSWSTSFLLRRSGYISCVHWPFSVSSHLSSHVSFRNSSNFLPYNISSYLLGSMSCCIFIAFIAICK